MTLSLLLYSLGGGGGLIGGSEDSITDGAGGSQTSGIMTIVLLHIFITITQVEWVEKIIYAGIMEYNIKADQDR